MADVPTFINLIFLVTSIATAVFLVLAFSFSKAEKTKKFTHFTALALLMWMIFMAALAVNKYFLDIRATPPKIAVPVMIITGIILLLFLLPRGRRILDGLSLEVLTWLHIVRIPVEIVLFLLVAEKMIPVSMTFEGINFDIISGISAPVMAFLYFRKKAIGKKFLLIWNFICLGLVLNVVINGVLSVPSPIQVLNLDHPNMAVLYFPYSWLPTFVVPAVVFSHLVAIRSLLKKTPSVS